MTTQNVQGAHLAVLRQGGPVLVQGSFKSVLHSVSSVSQTERVQGAFASVLRSAADVVTSRRKTRVVGGL